MIDKNGVDFAGKGGKKLFYAKRDIAGLNERHCHMVARIYRPAKTAMQSGKAKTHRWVLDYEPEVAKSVEPLMGYTSSSDMKQQVRLFFETQEEAVAYAKRHGIAHRVEKAQERKVRGSAYADNFRFNRVAPWTH